MIVQCATFSKSESSKYREKRFRYPDPYPVPVRRQFLDIRSGCKLTILPDIQPANRILIISDRHQHLNYVHLAASNTNSTLNVESGQRWMHSKIVPAEFLPLMARYTLPFNKSIKSHYNYDIFDVVRIITSK